MECTQVQSIYKSFYHAEVTQSLQDDGSFLHDHVSLRSGEKGPTGLG